MSTDDIGTNAAGRPQPAGGGQSGTAQAGSAQRTALERDARAALDASAARLDARIQSRLNQARHRAVEELAARQQRPAWQRWFGMGGGFGLVPAGAVAGVALVAVVLWTGRPEGRPGGMDTAAAFEDIELLADADALDLSTEADTEFVEWAALTAGESADTAVGT